MMMMMPAEPENRKKYKIAKHHGSQNEMKDVYMREISCVMLRGVYLCQVKKFGVKGFESMDLMKHVCS